jgi:hypothetical protein
MAKDEKETNRGRWIKGTMEHFQMQSRLKFNDVQALLCVLKEA